MHIPTFHIKTFGCKVNQYESELIREGFIRLGFEGSSLEEADVVLVNSCTVTAQADSRVRAFIRKAARENPNARLIVTGCYVSFEQDRRGLNAMSGVWKLVPNGEKALIPSIAAETLGIPGPYGDPPSGVEHFAFHTRAFLKIQDGCDNRCAYCKVSLARGPSASRNENDILKELEGFVRRGYREIVLTGICMGSWQGCSGGGLEELLKRVDSIRGDFRVRLSSIEPGYVTKGVISAVAGSKKIARHLHIPLQSGSDRILALMRRGYDRNGFLALVARVREKIPLCGITLDIISGFPKESETDHADSLDLLEKIKPSRTHVFCYSDRAGTEAYLLDEKVPRQVIIRRAAELSAAGERWALEFAGAFIGKTVQVLVEKNTGQGPSRGYTDEYVEAIVPAQQVRRGEIENVIAKTTDGKAPILVCELKKHD